MISNTCLYFQKVAKKIIFVTVSVNGQAIIYCSPDDIFKTLFFIKNHTLARYRLFLDQTVTDFDPTLKYSELSYFFCSVKYSHLLTVKCVLGAKSQVVSCASLFSGLAWAERESWDLFGTHFVGHNDLRRILTDYGFNGHPLKKNFPLSGYVEVCYSVDKKRVTLAPLELTKEFRMMDFSSAWLAS